MTTVRFRSGGVDLELHGSESFVLRQLHSLAPFLGRVDAEALGASPSPVAPQVAGATPAPTAPRPEVGMPEVAEDLPRAPANGIHDRAAPAAPLAVDRPPEPGDAFLEFCRSHPLRGKDQQSDAALLFAYWLHQREGVQALRLGDLLRCCIRAGVDTRNFNRAIGGLVRRNFLQPLENGSTYRLSEQGIAFVESR